MNTRSGGTFRSDLERATGTLTVAVKRRGAATVLADLCQNGCLKARFPRSICWFETVALNSSGGVAGGDVLQTDVLVGSGARATFTTQAAERFYRARPADPPARVRNRIVVAADAAMEWLPQETILFDGAAVDRRLEIELAPGAWFLGLESLIFGRVAMGEQLSVLHLADTIRVHRDGQLLLHDAVRLAGNAAAVLRRPAVARGAVASATLIHVARDAESRLEPLRAVWMSASAETGASAWNGMLIGRVLAGNAIALRQTVIQALTCLRGGRPLPRLWWS